MGDYSASGSEEIEVKHPPHPRQLKVLTTLAVLLGNVAFGCAFNFLSPALENFRVRYGTTVDHISVVFTIMAITYCLGAVTSGYVYYYVNRQLGVIICLGGMTLVLFTIPHCDSLNLFFIMGAVNGLFIGSYDTAQITWIIEIWKSESGPFIQAQHFCYALGVNIPPLLLGPFLPHSNSTGNNSTNVEPSATDLTTPFSIAGTFTTAACAFQVILFLFFRYYVPPEEDSSSETEPLISHQGQGQGHIIINNQDNPFPPPPTQPNWRKIRLIVLSATFLAAYSSMEVNSIQFLPTFAKYSALSLSESDSAFVLSCLTSSFALGRFLGIFVILRVPPHLMLSGSLFLILLGNSALLLWGDGSLVLLVLSGVTLGFGFSTTYPSMCALMEKHLVFSNAVGAAVIVSGAVVSATYPLIIGGFIEKNVDILTYTNFCSLTVCWLALGAFCKLTYNNKSKVG